MMPKVKPAIAEQPLVGQLIRELRQTMNLTQEKFADKLGMTFPTINRWENGHTTPSPLALKQVQMLLQQLASSPDATLRERGQTLQTKYFSVRDTHE